MKQLIKVKGPHGLSSVEVTLHIANLSYQYREDRKIFEDDTRPHDEREGAYKRMCRARDMLSKWIEVRVDILKKGGEVPQRKVSVS